MVGVPRSRGCRTCVKRRVKVRTPNIQSAPCISCSRHGKCDERVPGCAKCETYGQPCPGYDKGFKFIAGKPYRTKRKQPVLQDGGISKKQQPGCSSFDVSSSSTDTGSSSPDSILVVAPKVEPSILVSADLNVLQSLNVLIDDFSQPAPATQNNVVTHWFGFLPSIYGCSQTLDATIKSFVAHHFGKTFQNEQMVHFARSSYGEALHRLRKSLTHSSEAFSTHVFCAVVLLCMYEVSSWVEFFSPHASLSATFFIETLTME